MSHRVTRIFINAANGMLCLSCKISSTLKPMIKSNFKLDNPIDW